MQLVDGVRKKVTVVKQKVRLQQTDCQILAEQVIW